MVSYWDNGQHKFGCETKEGLFCLTAVVITIIVCVTIIIIN